jgi:hypothetical protein
VVFYTNYPPGPKSARAVYDLYLRQYGSRIRRFIPTIPGSLPNNWDIENQKLFEDKYLPELRLGINWGYGFDDGKILDSYVFMFHGFRPVREKGKVSFFRFEFPWNIDQDEIREFAINIAKLISFESGFGGFFLQVAPYVPEGYNKMYAICRRFWGIEAWNLDVSVNYVLEGYQNVNWLTFIGNSLQKRSPEAIQKAKKAATNFFETSHGVILQASEHALFGDRNRGEKMPGYIAVAHALLPIQLTTFGSFGGERWDEYNSFNWIRRFTHPDLV